MGQNVSGAWLSVPLAEELLAELEQYNLEAPDSFWGGSSCARFRWAVNVGRWMPQGGAEGEEFKMLLSLLPFEEQEQVMQYRALPDKKRTLIGRLLSLRACAQALGDPAYDQIQIGRTKGKKPFLHSPLPGSLPNFNFNISHDGSWVVLASDCLYLVGVDVSAPQRERGDHEDETWFQDMTSVLTENERESIKGGKTHQERYAIFQRIWSAKEAVSKAVGSGLSFGFERMEVTLPGESEGGLGNMVLSAIGWPRSDVEKPPGKRSRMNFSSLLANLQGGQRGQGGGTERGDQPPRPPEKTGEAPQHKPSRVDLHIDHWPRSDWIVEQQEFSGGSWVTVALGPVYDAVDADGIFKTTFRLPGLGGPTNVEGLMAKAQTEASRHWIPEAQGFQQLAVDALAPQKVRGELTALKARLLTAAAGV